MIAVILAGVISLLYTLVLTPLFVKGFRKLEWGQFIREDGPKSHYAKRGTPTMGGIVFVTGAVFAYFVAKAIMGETPTVSALLVILMSVGCGIVGFVDDYMKTLKQQSLGLGGWAKITGQVAVGVAFALIALNFPNEHGVTPASTSISLFRDTAFDLMAAGTIIGLILFILWVVFIATATSNSVNLTDGLDGLAAGTSIFVFISYIIIGFWQFSQSCFAGLEPGCYEVRDPMDLVVIAAAFTGAIIGFLWWNTSPALLYMGDTGSMAIGGAIAALAILTKTELLLIVLGGVFIMETLSVILQRLFFKVTGGKRIFRMSPIHHHFELGGWPEVTVVVRFWIMAGILALSGVGMFYGEWLIIND
ncbi:phospho-N-acetylmuramoyl-pentapeptide-transferase [Leucobacter sp. OH1287]|uniref:phospho-N-acetylmuramoyl-pentapeptide- transferase n=1 Tax=Leucobacter sp. OH1287 TaxID=2491049 RepID=UPI000F5E11B1|nr:phospho-N-acetylmuramoyl-pentapeptide-transferase [Leucobacter sp. OH1287]RRD60212.1 phospho-N-acetylmuramoyl-pentapeptide-transferase [Leucobacter sp. OH1287]